MKQARVLTHLGDNVLHERGTIRANRFAGFIRQVEERLDEVDRHREHDHKILPRTDLRPGPLKADLSQTGPLGLISRLRGRDHAPALLFPRRYAHQFARDWLCPGSSARAPFPLPSHVP